MVKSTMIETFVSNIFLGVDQAYIYIWISKIHKAVYVGMTNDRVGTLGRASAHLNPNGTLRKQFLNSKGYPIDTTDDFKLLTFALPRKKEYCTVERSYREGVEYLVQKELLLIRGTLSPTFDVISWVRNSPRTGNAEVIATAKSIVARFVSEYSRL